MKKILFLIFIFVLAIGLVGCNNNNNNMVWKSYSDDYIGIKYPEDCKLTKDISDNVTTLNFKINDKSKENIIFNIKLSNFIEIDSLATFNLFVKYVEEELYESEDAILDISENMTIDGYKSYKIGGITKSDNMKGFVIFVYYAPRQVFMITYDVKKDKYDKYIELINKMIDSIEIFKYKDNSDF